MRLTRTFAVGTVLCTGLWIGTALAQEPSVIDRAGDWFKNLIPGQSNPQPAPPPVSGPPPASQAPAVQGPPVQGPPAQGPAAQAPAAPSPTPAGQPAPPGDQPPPAPRSARNSDPSITDRVGDFFKRLIPGGNKDEQTSALPAGRASNGQNPQDEFDCPAVDIREGASTLMVQGQGTESAALGLRYQASFVRAARECIVKGKDVTIKVGVQGRIILGPAGGAGQMSIPLRYALVHEELGRTRMIWSKMYVLPVEIAGAQPSVPFQHVEEDMTVPIPKASELENYIVYIGFDPNGLPPEPKKPAPKAKPKKPS
jgi:hypothetical protein